MSDPFRPHGLSPTTLLHPWDFPGKSTGVGCYFLLQRIFLTQGWNPDLPHCRQMLYHPSHRESPELLGSTMKMLLQTFVLCVVDARLTGLKHANCICKYQQKRIGACVWVRACACSELTYLTCLLFPTQPNLLFHPLLYLFPLHLCCCCFFFFSPLPLIRC